MQLATETAREGEAEKLVQLRAKAAPQGRASESSSSSSGYENGKGRKSQRRKKRNHKRKSSDPLVGTATTGQRSQDSVGKGGRGAKWCPIQRSTKHDLTECRANPDQPKELASAPPPPPRRPADPPRRQRQPQRQHPAPAAAVREAHGDEDEDEAQQDGIQIAFIYGGSMSVTSKRQMKALEREVNSVTPQPFKPLKWSDKPIGFDLSDHPPSVPHPGRWPLVVDPVINNCRVMRALVDGGSSLNLLFVRALDAMEIPRSDLRPSNISFHGIIPGTSASPIGQIELLVTFGTPENFRTEKILFEVAGFDMGYNVILGRPALAKFMAVVHYAYQAIKIPTKKGSLTVRGSDRVAFQCEKTALEMAGELARPPASVEDTPKHAKSGGSSKQKITVKGVFFINEIIF